MISLIRGIYEFYESRIRRNLPGFFREYRFYLIIVVMAALLDWASTYRFMSAIGIDTEVNPVMRYLSYYFGPWIGPLIGKFGQLAALLFVTLVFRRFARIILIPIIVIYFYAAWYNVYGVNIYTPLFVKWLSALFGNL